jgi:excisionase family DNA binding protein
MTTIDLLRVKEVAAILGVHEYSVRRWLSKGALPFVKVGGRTRIRRSDLERFIRPGKPAAERGRRRQQR